VKHYPDVIAAGTERLCDGRLHVGWFVRSSRFGWLYKLLWFYGLSSKSIRGHSITF